MTPNEKVRVRLSLELQKPLPLDIAQKVLKQLNLAYGHDGKRSLSYKSALALRNEHIKSAFDALPGQPWGRCTELSCRVISEQLGEDTAGQFLKLAAQVRKIPSTVRQLSTICGLSCVKN